MVDGHAEMPDRALPVLVGAELEAGATGYGHPVEPWPVLPERLALADLHAHKSRIDVWYKVTQNVGIDPIMDPLRGLG